MNNYNLISIITPTFNSQDFIGEVYKSIKNQTYTNWEWVITDDCSTDDTYDVISKLSKQDPRIKVFKNDINSGAALTRNNSIVKSCGNYLAFIDSDDFWCCDKLEKQLEFMESNCIDFSFTAFELIDGNNNKLNVTVDSNQISPLSYEDMLRKKATLGCSTVMLRREAFTDISMPNIRTGQDYALWLKLLKSNVLAYPFSSILTHYRILPDSISRNKFKKAKRQWEIYRRIECLPLLKSLECFFFYAWRAVFRK